MDHTLLLRRQRDVGILCTPDFFRVLKEIFDVDWPWSVEPVVVGLGVDVLRIRIEGSLGSDVFR